MRSARRRRWVVGSRLGRFLDDPFRWLASVSLHVLLRRRFGPQIADPTIGGVRGRCTGGWHTLRLWHGVRAVGGSYAVRSADSGPYLRRTEVYTACACYVGGVGRIRLNRPGGRVSPGWTRGTNGGTGSLPANSPGACGSTRSSHDMARSSPDLTGPTPGLTRLGS